MEELSHLPLLLIRNIAFLTTYHENTLSSCKLIHLFLPFILRRVPIHSVNGLHLR